MSRRTSLNLLSIPLRFLTFLLSLYLLGASSYHAHRIRTTSSLSPSSEFYAIIIISGVGTLYSLLSLVQTCFFGRFRFGLLLVAIFDLLFCAGNVAIAVLLRHAADRRDGECGRRVWTKRGTTYRGGEGGKKDCNVDTAGFAVAVGNA